MVMLQQVVTLETVAKHAGVSMKSVSRVVNNELNVSKKMKDKVLQSIKELNYQPNLAARQLRGQRSYSLALIYERPASEFLTGILEGVSTVCRNLSYKLLIEPLAPTEPRPHIMKMIERGVADGFILLPPLSEDVSLIKSIIDAKLQVVLIESSLDTEKLDLPVTSISIDDYAAGVEMGRYLIKRGHKDIGYVGLREQHTKANLRGKGLKAAMLEAGLEEENFHFAAGKSTFESGYEAAKKLLKKATRPTAIFAGNDYMAAGVIACAKDMKLDVPNDLSVAGFDGADLSKMFVPPFMTIKQPLKEYGEQATRQLIAAINNPEIKPHNTQLNFTLIPRNSVKQL